MNLYYDQTQDQAAYEVLRKIYLYTKSDAMRHVMEGGQAMYREGRKEAGLTLEEAAWRLNVAPRTLGKYEAGELRVPPETVFCMGQIYNKPELPLHHCAEKCAIGRVYHPTFEVGNVATGTLQLMRELQDVNERMGSLVSIAADGHISPEELPELVVILQELTELGEAIERMKLLGIKKIGLGKGEEAA